MSAGSTRDPAELVSSGPLESNTVPPSDTGSSTGSEPVLPTTVTAALRKATVEAPIEEAPNGEASSHSSVPAPRAYCLRRASARLYSSSVEPSTPLCWSSATTFRRLNRTT